VTNAVLCVPTSGLSGEPRDFFEALRTRLSVGERVVTFYGRAGEDEGSVVLTVVLEAARRLQALRTTIRRDDGFHALSRDFPSLSIFEREIYEQTNAKPHDHPWLKPVRVSREHTFYRVEGKEVHEVAVGPIHAGVIEPGHFRFTCLGETVHHLEIQLGFQHRGAEAELLKHEAWRLAPRVETLAGDSSVAHTWAYCAAIEALAGLTVPAPVGISRGIALELERVAMHLATLAGMCADIALLQGAATYGRLRTTAINTSMLLCGSRFGRSWLRPGGATATMSVATAKRVQENLALLADDLVIVDTHVSASRSVAHRLVDVGIVPETLAVELGLVGLAARASGVELDARTSLAGAPYDTRPPERVVEVRGDCWARARVRMRELDVSLHWLRAAVDAAGELAPSRAKVSALAPDTLAVAVCEGVRGEVVHALETDPIGRLRHYKAQDPSLRNWHALAMALRNEDISDFPICNKSFDLSYCGHDL
jgi:Ni,Fe-hydrogenase III large subunit